MSSSRRITESSRPVAWNVEMCWCAEFHLSKIEDSAWFVAPVRHRPSSPRRRFVVAVVVAFVVHIEVCGDWNFTTKIKES